MNIATSPLNKLLSVTLGKFLTVGVLNTVITMAVIFLAKALLGFGDVPANASGYVAGMLCSFILNKNWTFVHKGNTFEAAIRFILVCGLAYMVNLAVLKVFLSIGLDPYLCHILAMPFYTLVFFIGSKAIVFVKYNKDEMQETHSKSVSHSATARNTSDTSIDRRSLFGRDNGLLFLCMLALSAIVLFYRLTDDPIQLWDESRLANNALEMSKNGLSLITTYGWLPDHWNTKPPLLIWLMTVSMNLVGINELGVRLPSVLASLGTIILVYGFVGHHTRRPVQAFTAVLIILATPGYIQIHGARSGNYDALLTLLTTAYIMSAFMFLEAGKQKKLMYFVLTTIAIVLAFYTKTIQGLIFLPGIFLYALFTKKIIAILKTPYFYVGCFLAIASCISYYYFRNKIDPGYLAAVQANDLGGRYANALEGHDGSPLWYLLRVKFFPWLVPSLMTAFYMLFRGPKELKRLIAFVAIALFSYLAVISSAGTKLVWYAMPLAPLCAMIVAMGAGEIVEKISLGTRQAGRNSLIAVGVMAAVAVVGLNILLVHKSIAKKEADPYEQHSFALRSLVGSNQPKGELVVLHPGYPVGQLSPFYVAPTLFYANALALAGTPTSIVQYVSQINKDATLLVCGAHSPIPGRSARIALNSGAGCVLQSPEN